MFLCLQGAGAPAILHSEGVRGYALYQEIFAKDFVSFALFLGSMYENATFVRH